MRVLHFTQTYYPHSYGGIEQFIFQLSESLVPHNVESCVLSLAPTPTASSTYGAHRVEYAPLNFQLASMRVSRQAFKKFKALVQDYDLIHYHYPWPFMDLVHLFTQPNQPSLITYHSDIVRQKNLLTLYKPLQRYFLNAISHIVATSPQYLETSSTLQQYAHKTSVIPIGLSHKAYPEASPECLAKWRAKFSEPFFLFVGTMRYYKGLHLLLELAAAHHYPIVIVGEGPMEAQLKTQASQKNLSHLHFVGALPDEDKIALLTLCYALLFPSHQRSEAFGISLLEGAMFGKALISSELGTGTSYVNQHGETGIVVPPNDAAALGCAMQSLWEDLEGTARMGRAAKARYENLFTAEQMAQSYFTLYEQLLAR